jgi:hypothetical protein
MLTYSFVIARKRKTLHPTQQNIGSFSKAPSDSYPPNLSMMKSNCSNAKPFHGCAFSVPKAYKSRIHNEVDCLCHLNVLCQCNESEWAAPSFRTPKKNGQI